MNYKSFLQSSRDNDKEGLTVLMGYSATGKIAPPMIVYAYKQHIPRHVAEAVESHVGCRKVRHWLDDKSDLL